MAGNGLSMAGIISPAFGIRCHLFGPNYLLRQPLPPSLDAVNHRMTRSPRTAQPQDVGQRQFIAAGLLRGGRQIGRGRLICAGRQLNRRQDDDGLPGLVAGGKGKRG